MKHNWVETDESPDVSPYKCSYCGEPLVASNEEEECPSALAQVVQMSGEEKDGFVDALKETRP